MNLKQADRKIAFDRAKDEAVKKLLEKVTDNLTFQMELVMCMALHDKFGFGKERCQKAIDEFENIWESLQKSHITGLTMEDVADVVRKELKMEVDQDQLDIATLRKAMTI